MSKRFSGHNAPLDSSKSRSLDMSSSIALIVSSFESGNKSLVEVETGAMVFLYRDEREEMASLDMMPVLELDFRFSARCVRGISSRCRLFEMRGCFNFGCGEASSRCAAVWVWFRPIFWHQRRIWVCLRVVFSPPGWRDDSSKTTELESVSLKYQIRLWKKTSLHCRFTCVAESM